MRLGDFLLFCSGAETSILEQCPTEKNKFYGIGSTVLLTSLLAMLSGGYAVYFTFQSVLVSIVIGVFWGIVIFSLDRYIVSSIKKSGSFIKELPMALPRIFMAVILALTISKPLELRLFQDAVAKKMGEIADMSIATCEKEWNTQRDAFAKKKSDLEDERKVKTEELFSKDGIYRAVVGEQNDLASKNKQLSDKVASNNQVIAAGTTFQPVKDENGVVLYTKKVYSREAQNAMANNKTLRNEIGQNNARIKELDLQRNARRDTLKGQLTVAEQQYAKQILGVQQQIDDHNSKRQGFLMECTTRSKNAKDIPARLEALSFLTKENSSIYLASWLITLLFVLLETAPVVVKLLSARGPYDEIIDRMDYEKTIEQKIKISELNDTVNTEMRISTERNRIKLEAELKANEELMNEIAAAQAEIAKEAVKKWKEKELNKLANGQNDVIDSGNEV
jgi:hypothetical protein